MKKILYISAMISAAMLSLVGCKTEYTTYDGPSAIAFADTASLCPVVQSGDAYGIDIAATAAADHDRTFAVEAVPSKSTAVYGKHFVIDDQTVTIKAGETATKVYVKGIYDNVDSSDDIYVTLRLVGEGNEDWPFNSTETKVYLTKICPFNIDDYTGWCRVSSSFLIAYANKESNLAKVEKVDDETIVIKGMFQEGYDVKFRFDVSDMLHPTMYMLDETPVGNTRTFMNYVYGNGLLLGGEMNGYSAELHLCDKYAEQYMKIRVDGVGTVGLYVNILEFLTDEEAGK